MSFFNNIDCKKIPRLALKRTKPRYQLEKWGSLVYFAKIMHTLLEP